MTITRVLDSFINSITMYRAVLYGLAGLAAYAIVFGFAGMLPFSGAELLISLAALLAVCALTNALLSWIYRAPTNVESSFITAFILFFILPPFGAVADVLWLTLGGAVAVASKYVIARNGKHIFNPAAFAAVVLGVIPAGGTVWWVGDSLMLPATLLVGLFIVRKIRRFPLFFACAAVAAAAVLAVGVSRGTQVSDIVPEYFVSWPIFFFAAIMVTEPLTTPPTRNLQILYGALIGFFSTWPIDVGMFHASPEMALVLGNLAFYPFGMRRRITLVLKEKISLARDTYEFIFRPPQTIAFKPGQYLEWMLPHKDPDTRGVRRFFTIASSPTEADIRLGMRFNPAAASSFKRTLFALTAGESLYAGQLAGDFTLPRNHSEKLVFLAGGIGITPFRSMLKYFLDRREKRDVVLFYGTRSAEDIAYGELLKSAEKELGVKIIYLVIGDGELPAGVVGERGFLASDMVMRYVPDWRNRTFYLSGPNAMVDAYKKLLIGMGVLRSRIVTDYFPGYA
ncbi:oxidoreductase [Candidatus Wolfebacteria bacterium]|nr:oxidoreductase [Candidatus Wolfebacteria bacterium]